MHVRDAIKIKEAALKAANDELEGSQPTRLIDYINKQIEKEAGRGFSSFHLDFDDIPGDLEMPEGVINQRLLLRKIQLHYTHNGFSVINRYSTLAIYWNQPPQETKEDLKSFIGEGKLMYAVVTPYKGKGEDKLILHEVIIDDKVSFGYGNKKVLVANTNSVKIGE